MLEKRVAKKKKKKTRNLRHLFFLFFFFHAGTSSFVACFLFFNFSLESSTHSKVRLHCPCNCNWFF